MKRFHLQGLLAASTLLLSLASLLVVMQGASHEPYAVFLAADAVVQIGVALMLMLLWLQLAVAMMVAVVRRRVSAWWVLLLVWTFLCGFYLFQCPSGYIQDIARHGDAVGPFRSSRD